MINTNHRDKWGEHIFTLYEQNILYYFGDFITNFVILKFTMMIVINYYTAMPASC